MYYVYTMPPHKTHTTSRTEHGIPALSTRLTKTLYILLTTPQANRLYPTTSTHPTPNVLLHLRLHFLSHRVTMGLRRVTSPFGRYLSYKLIPSMSSPHITSCGAQILRSFSTAYPHSIPTYQRIAPYFKSIYYEHSIPRTSVRTTPRHADVCARDPTTHQTLTCGIPTYGSNLRHMDDSYLLIRIYFITAGSMQPCSH